MKDSLEPLPPPPAKLPAVTLRVMNSGWVRWHEAMVLTGGSKAPLRVPALFALLTHPTHGHVLFDTGYHTRFFTATRWFPSAVLRWATPAEISTEGQAAQQLARLGVEPTAVRTIILSHGHADHTGGLADFPSARLIVDHREWRHMHRPSLVALGSAYVKGLYQRAANAVTSLDFEAQGKPYGPFPKSIDLWGDGTMVLFPLEGHSAGQLGLLVTLADGRRVLFVSDAAHVRQNIERQVAVGAHVRLIGHSSAQYAASLRLLHQLGAQHPELIMVPSHCPRAWEQLVSLGLGA